MFSVSGNISSISSHCIDFNQNLATSPSASKKLHNHKRLLVYMQVRFQLGDIFFEGFFGKLPHIQTPTENSGNSSKSIPSVVQEDNRLWFPCLPPQGSPAVHNILTQYPDLVLEKILSFFFCKSGAFKLCLRLPTCSLFHFLELGITNFMIVMLSSH